ncbi:hypothetical protein IIA79_05985 [bacterium]|nr:hypothetical protein [bacterium]
MRILLVMGVLLLAATLPAIADDALDSARGAGIIVQGDRSPPTPGKADMYRITVLVTAKGKVISEQEITLAGGNPGFTKTTHHPTYAPPPRDKGVKRFSSYLVFVTPRMQKTSIAEDLVESSMMGKSIVLVPGGGHNDFAAQWHEDHRGQVDRILAAAQKVRIAGLDCYLFYPDADRIEIQVWKSTGIWKMRPSYMVTEPGWVPSNLHEFPDPATVQGEWIEGPQFHASHEPEWNWVARLSVAHSSDDLGYIDADGNEIDLNTELGLTP